MQDPANLNVYAAVLHHVGLSLQAEQVFCSIVTEMKFMPAFRDDPHLQTVHKENYETSYHRNTAAGNLRRLLTGAFAEEDMLVLMTIECFVEAKAHDLAAEQALRAIPATTESQQHWLRAAERWHMRRRRELSRAKRILRSHVSAETWQKGVALAE
ncbi:MAG: hypothetical protein K6T26_00850 [Alicyclobacillus sp.]|nr:hypothetical protein [Alicyclobacillus sp.]